MDIKSINFSYEKKMFWSEIIYLFLIALFIPFFVGIQIWDRLSFTFGLITVNILQLPSVIFFYKVVLPMTILRKRYILFVLVILPYLLLYELNSRLASVIVIHTPFIPLEYRNLLLSAHPEDFSTNIFNQTFGYTFLLLLTAASLAIIKELFKQQRKVYEIAYDKVQLELHHLKSQVQPHFFFNTLNNLYTLSLQKSDLAPVMISNLSEIMRYVIYESEQEKVFLERELNFLSKYVALEKIRLSSPDLVEFVVQGDPGTCIIAPLLFLPLIENCFKHAGLINTQHRQIRLVMIINDDELIFQTFNQVHREQRDADYKGGIGLTNVRKRLDLIYPGQHDLSIEETQNTFEVMVTIKI